MVDEMHPLIGQRVHLLDRLEVALAGLVDGGDHHQPLAQRRLGCRLLRRRRGKGQDSGQAREQRRVQRSAHGSSQDGRSAAGRGGRGLLDVEHLQSDDCRLQCPSAFDNPSAGAIIGTERAEANLRCVRAGLRAAIPSTARGPTKMFQE